MAGILLLCLVVAASGARPGYSDEASSILEGKDVRAHDQLNHSSQVVRHIELKVMQLNILADGLANDGFLSPRALDTQSGFFARVQDVSEMVKGLKAIPIDKKKKEKEKDKPTKYYKQEHTTAALLENPLPVANLLHPQERGEEAQTSERRVDWEHRKYQIMELVRRAEPDILTMQEVDHYEELEELLGLWGYTSESGGGTPYKQLKLDRLTEMDAVVKKWKAIAKQLDKDLEDNEEALRQALVDVQLTMQAHELAEKALQKCAMESTDLEHDMLSPPTKCKEDEIVALEKAVAFCMEQVRDKEEAVADAKAIVARKNDEIKGKPGKEQEEVNVVYDRHLALLGANGYAFAPKGNSNARKVWMLKKKGMSTKTEDMDKDDEGNTIFWKKSKLKLATVDENVLVMRQKVALPGDPKAAVRVVLEAVENPEIKLAVLTTHLASGPEKELRRHFELNSMNNEMFYELSGMYPFIFAADLNSDINFDPFQPRVMSKPMGQHLKTTCFNIITAAGEPRVEEYEPQDKDSTEFSDEEVPIHEWGMRSIYSRMLETLRPTEFDRRPPTVLKMRGPGTDQPHKMGEFQLETIDHIFYSNPGKSLLHLSSDAEVLGPPLPKMTSKQMKAYSKLLDQGLAMGQEVAGTDGVLWWRRAGQEEDPIRLGTEVTMIEPTKDDWELNRITQYMLPSFYHPTDHLALVGHFALYAPRG